MDLDPLILYWRRKLCQLKNTAYAAAIVLVFVVHVIISWLFLDKLKFGVIVAVVTLDFSWWVAVAVQFGYVMWGGCPDSWKGFSFEAFYELREFVKLSAASGVTRCLECWYYRTLLLLAGNLKNTETAVDALSVW
uniref:Uncharacterized protein n=1 Tax=Ananas comosus var. bracteatus TaxID=296719 RepID=A0A6V7P6K6_ANACO|nr:unnamed protein product [Ananas comosus var. bracteatus]